MPDLVHIVDDDASFRTSIGRLLQASGYDAKTYVSGNQFLEQLPEDSRPSCILLDVRIPDLTGPELQERLAELGSPLPIIFLTGHGDISTSVKAIKAGAEDFLTKPVAKDRLLDAIERAIARYRAAQERREPPQRVAWPLGNPDASGEGGLRTGCPWKNEQADRS